MQHLWCYEIIALLIIKNHSTQREHYLIKSSAFFVAFICTKRDPIGSCGRDNEIRNWQFTYLEEEKIMRNIVFSTYARKFLEGILNGDETLVNPAIKFTKDAKIGKYDDTPDEDYKELLACCEQAAIFWNDKTSASSSKLLQEMLIKSGADRTTMTYMAIALYSELSDIYIAESEKRADVIPMRFFVDYVAQFLEGIVDDNKMRQNPNDEFLVLSSIGDIYDSETLEKLAQHCHQASVFWNGKSMESSANLLRNALKLSYANETVLDRAVGELAECYEKNVEKLEKEEYFTEEEFVKIYLNRSCVEDFDEDWDPEARAHQSYYDGVDYDSRYPIVRLKLSDAVKEYYGEDTEKYFRYTEITEFNIDEGMERDMRIRECDNCVNKKEDDYVRLEKIIHNGIGVEKWNPKDIYDYVKTRIYGQDEAVKVASMLLYNHMRKHKRNVLFLGPTGSGKTEIWRVLSEIYSNIRIIDCTRLSMEGWKGDYKIKNIFEDLSDEEAENTILVLDEFDKMCEPKHGTGGTDWGRAIQNELLKFIEGADIICNYKSEQRKINTSKISFVFCGSFERLMVRKVESSKTLGFGSVVDKKDEYSLYKENITQDDLANEGNVLREICGRINQIVQLRPMNSDDYERMLNTRLMSPLERLEREYSVKLHLDNKSRRKIVELAVDNKMGVRYIYSTLQRLLDDEMFKEVGKEEYTLCMGD